ncbi:MAG: inositol monophosphatase family protein [Anaerolineae bacterium]
MEPNIREFAIALAERAGELLLQILARGLDEERTRTKAGHFDIVTEADLASEQLILDALRAAFPAHAIYAEESAEGGLPAAEWLWLVDPVDGTTNYSHGLPIYAVNLALAHRGLPILGITHDPANRQTFWAERGGGAWLRNASGADRRLAVSTVAELSHSLLATGFIHGRVKGRDRSRDVFWALDDRTQSVRRLGSAAMALAWVAAGHLDAYWEAGLKPWDMAAGWLLVAEAGGRVTQYDGSPVRLDSPTLIASNGQPGIHDEIMLTIAQVQQANRR